MDAAIASGLAAVISYVFSFIQLLVFASIIISFVGGDPSHPVVQIITQLTEPMYRPFRPLTRRFSLPIDLAPLFVIAILIFLDKSIVAYLRQKAMGL